MSCATDDAYAPLADWEEKAKLWTRTHWPARKAGDHNGDRVAVADDRRTERGHGSLVDQVAEAAQTRVQVDGGVGTPLDRARHLVEGLECELEGGEVQRLRRDLELNEAPSGCLVERPHVIAVHGDDEIIAGQRRSGLRVWPGKLNRTHVDDTVQEPRLPVGIGRGKDVGIGRVPPR